MDQGAIGECNPYCQEIGFAKRTIEWKAVYICGCPIWDLPFVSARYDIVGSDGSFDEVGCTAVLLKDADGGAALPRLDGDNLQAMGRVPVQLRRETDNVLTRGWYTRFELPAGLRCGRHGRMDDAAKVCHLPCSPCSVVALCSA
eukprot:470983-Prymnesium_polylepis.1